MMLEDLRAHLRPWPLAALLVTAGASIGVVRLIDILF